MITQIGKQKLIEHIAELKKELERTFDERGHAAAEGDLKENSAYIFLGEQAHVLNNQIQEAVAELKTSVVAPVPTQTDTISFGHKVTLRFDSDLREMTITLVGKNDARLKSDWISIDSPLGIALINHRQSDKVMVNGQPVTILDIAIGEI